MENGQKSSKIIMFMGYSPWKKILYCILYFTIISKSNLIIFKRNIFEKERRSSKKEKKRRK